MLAYEDAAQHAGRGAAAVSSFVSSGMGDDLEDILVDESDPHPNPNSNPNPSH